MAFGGQRGWGSPSIARGARRAGPAAWLQGAAGHCFRGRSSRQAGVTGGAPGAGGGLFIARAARVTEPGRADGAADALGRGAEGAGCARAVTMGRSARLPGLRRPLSGSRPRLRAPSGVAGLGLGPRTQLGSPRSHPRARTAGGAGAGLLDHSAPGDAATWGRERWAGNVYWTGLGGPGGPGAALPRLLSPRWPAPRQEAEVGVERQSGRETSV